MAVLPAVLLLVALAFCAPVVLYAASHLTAVGDRVAAAWHRLRRPDQDGADGRPFEEVAGEIRRLGRRYHSAQVSHVKAEGLRRCYDEVLSEGCAALGVDHLLGVIEPGPELDRERARVEQLLHRRGLDLSGLRDLGDLGDAA